ncbi:hypothetical protein J6P92_02370 [bacterium]|nr:hypothetical protein [bacterium]
MAITPVNNTIQTNTQNINFQGEKKSSTNEKLLKAGVAAAAVVGLGVAAHKGKWVEKAMKWLSESKLMTGKIYPNYEKKDNLHFMAMIGVLSIILKDGLGCYLYVKQSLNNKEIPDDKRKFVAALDLANGGLMIATQIIAFFTIQNKRVQKRLFDTLFGKKFTRTATKATQAKLKKLDGEFAKMTGEEFYKGHDQYKNGVSKAFGYLITLAASSIFAKRVVVPFIATPLADKTKAWMCRNDKPEDVNADTKNTYNANKIDADNKPEFKGSTQEQKEIKSTTSNLLEIAKQKANA